MSSAKDLENLRIDVITAEQDVEGYRQTIVIIRKTLIKAEDNLFDAKEALISAKEKVRVFEDVNVLESIVDDVRAEDIARFKNELPRTMKLIEDEESLSPIKIGDLKNSHH